MLYEEIIMPRIFDNINQQLLPFLQDTLKVSYRADFCVGYFNLRGWKGLHSYVDKWDGGEDACCRLLVGMQGLPNEQLLKDLIPLKQEKRIDNQTAILLKKRLAEDFRSQLTYGVPTNADELGLQKLAQQLRKKKLVVKLFLVHSLHAKLYLLHRKDPNSPIIGYLGSSNLTMAGLSRQGELNIDVLDHDATNKLAQWFEDRWGDRWCVDISEELATIIETSWAREELIPPYYIYLKMAYHLSNEARAGLSEFRIPKDFKDKLFEYQVAAVKIAAHHLNKRNGVLIGDVVGLGKTFIATALARIFEDDYDLETLIICPKNLVKMWEDYRDTYRLRGRVLSISKAINELPELRRYRIVVIDESHNLRNRDGKRYRAIQEYIQGNGCKVILLTATPYNKTYLDLSNQLRLFVQDDIDLGIRPEQYLKLRLNGSETEFIRRHQCPLRSLAAFEKSEYADDWQELMRLYMVRRTRSFIQDNYAEKDEDGRLFIPMYDGTKSYFPERIPKTLKFDMQDDNPNDQYAKLYAKDIVDAINSLTLPRYGLGNYTIENPKPAPVATEQRILEDLSRAGKRLMGFCRTNLFKRLESSGSAFIQSVERHILRNYIFKYAIEHEKPLPLGTQGAEVLDARIYDKDADDPYEMFDYLFDDDQNNNETDSALNCTNYPIIAEKIYADYENRYSTRFKWISSGLFKNTLLDELEKDIDILHTVINICGKWNPEKDTKLNVLEQLLTQIHPDKKVIIFSQFADTVNYLTAELKSRNIDKMAKATGNTADPTAVAWQFSPVSNNKRDKVAKSEELRVLIATDVLSEGQNLQDCSIVVNYDLPWAIIRLIQRVGRVDRIGQLAENIKCYTFLPADGIEKIIKLRARVRVRLQENAEVVGTDESFFEDDRNDNAISDLYHEKSGIFDGAVDNDVDLASYAYQIWKNATDEKPELKKIIPDLPSVVYATKKLHKTIDGPPGALVFVETSQGTAALAWIDENGKDVTESQLRILNAAKCSPDEPALERIENHHELVSQGVEYIIEEERSVGGQLGSPRGARFRTYERLKRYAADVKGTLFDSDFLTKVIEDIYRYPMRQTAIDTINRQLKSGVGDQELSELVINLREDNRLCLIDKIAEELPPKVISSMGLKGN
jgi:SNF2 family DNA or RNA helicase